MVVRAAAVLNPRSGAHARPANISRLTAMDLEEKTIEKPGDRCEVCGTKLTAAEIQAALESGGPALCSIHADEVVPVADDEADFGET